MTDDLLEPKPPVGITRGLIRQRDKTHVGSIWLNRDIDDEFENPATGQRHTSPIPRDIVLVVIRARSRRCWATGRTGRPPRPGAERPGRRQQRSEQPDEQDDDNDQRDGAAADVDAAASVAHVRAPPREPTTAVRGRLRSLRPS